MILESGKFPKNSKCPVLAAIRRLRFLLDGNAWVGGGAVRFLLGCKTEPTDIDIFFRGPNAPLTSAHAPFRDAQMEFEHMFRIRGDSTREYGGFSPQGTPFGITYRTPKAIYQFVTVRGFADERELIEDIDFTVCRGVTDGYQWVADARMRPDIEARRLVSAAATRVTSKVGRLVKYMTYGYTPVPGVMTQVFDLDDMPSMRKVLTNNLSWVDGNSSS